MENIWDASSKCNNRDDLSDITWSAGKGDTGLFKDSFPLICKDIVKIPIHPAIRTNLTTTSAADAVETSVRCSHTIIDPGTMKATMLAIAASKTITSISFNNCGLNDVALATLATGLSTTQVTSLAVDYNESIDITALCNLITCPQLTSLALRGNNLGKTEGNVQLLCDVLSKNTTLTHLTLYRNGLGDNGIKIVTRMLRRNKTIQMLSVGSNDITAKGLSDLIASVTCYTLTQIGLDERNELKNVSADAGGDKKKKKKGGDANGPVLDAIVSGGICEKDEEGNDIEDSNIATLGTICRGNTNIVRLDVSYNANMKNGSKEIIEEFISNSKEDILLSALTTLDIIGCGLSEEQVSECVKYLSTVRNVETEE